MCLLATEVSFVSAPSILTARFSQFRCGRSQRPSPPELSVRSLGARFLSVAVCQYLGVILLLRSMCELSECGFHSQQLYMGYLDVVFLFRGCM